MGSKLTNRARALLLGLSLAWVPTNSSVFAEDVCVILNGLGGLPEYEENFQKWADGLEQLFGKREGSLVLRADGRTQGRDEILSVLNRAAAAASGGEVWVFLVGHANHDGRVFKFQIKGPDLTDSDLKEFLRQISANRVFMVAGTSASGALLEPLAGPNRVIITATKNELERQPPLFLSFFVEAASSAEADVDKNGRVSLLEAFLFSRVKVEQWFEDKQRLQTEHSRLDDQGKVRLESSDESSAPPASEGLLAAVAYLSRPPERAYRSLEAQRLAVERQGVEREIEDLKFRKTDLPQAEYYSKLEELLVRLAELSEKIASLEGQP